MCILCILNKLKEWRSMANVEIFDQIHWIDQDWKWVQVIVCNLFTFSAVCLQTKSVLTASSCLQNMYDGGSGLSVMIHERFIVLPSLRWMSGPPKIAVLGSAKKNGFWKKKLKKNMYLCNLEWDTLYAFNRMIERGL